MITNSCLKISAILAALLCIAGGLVVILSAQGVLNDDFIWTGVGLYFIGKGVFVAPMLMSQSKSCCSPK